VIATAVGIVCLIAGGVLGFAIGHKIATLDATIESHYGD
jgi:hypothetical protein